MTVNSDLIVTLYRCFNERDIDGALAGMAEEVMWPKASEGGVIQGKEAIRAYWTRQWQEFDPHVEPLAISEHDGLIEARVHQVVKSPKGTVVSDSVVLHVFTVRNGLVERMQLGDEASAGAAFHPLPKD